MKLYKGIREGFSGYWEAYGGAKVLFRSGYLHFSVLFSVTCYPLWTGKVLDRAWYNSCLNIMPNILGFTLGGFAILLAFGDERFRRLLSGPDTDGKPSPFAGVSATFVHFIVVQILSILIALFCLAWETISFIINFIGFSCFIYALSTSVAAAMAIWRLVKWQDRFFAPGDDQGQKKN